jgi:hypothetical protein
MVRPLGTGIAWASRGELRWVVEVVEGEGDLVVGGM